MAGTNKPPRPKPQPFGTEVIEEGERPGGN